MEAGQRLRRRRESLRLTYRDVSEASSAIAARHSNEAYHVGLSRLADIEHNGTLPTIYRLYSLAAIYGLSFSSILDWYSVDVNSLLADSAAVPRVSTHVVDIEQPTEARIRIPVLKDAERDARHTFFLSRQIESWGTAAAALLPQPEASRNRYAFIGLEDWFMYPLLRPGSFVQIDEARRKVAAGGWENEWDRPIYLVEYHAGFRCAWCSVRGPDLILQPHPASQDIPETYKQGAEAEVVGEVVGAAMRFTQAVRRRKRYAIGPE